MMEIHVCQNQDKLIIVFKMYLKFDEKTINANIIECYLLFYYLKNIIFIKMMIQNTNTTPYYNSDVNSKPSWQRPNRMLKLPTPRLIN
jgi:hypothetical protein